MDSIQVQRYPKWLRDIVRLLPIRPQFVLSGNVRDEVFVASDPPRMDRLQSVLWECLSSLGFDGLLIWDVVDGIQAYPRERERIATLSRIADVDLSNPQPMALRSLGELIRRIAVPEANSRERVALIVDYASRLADEGRVADNTREFFAAAEKAAIEARPLRSAQAGRQPLFNPVIWLVNRPNDLPYWLTVDNERVRSVPIGMPDADTRNRAARQLYALIPDDRRNLDADAFAASLARLTHNMSLNALRDVVGLGRQLDINATDIDEAVQSFRVGDMSMTSPWRGEQLRQAIGRGEERIKQRVKGQDKAVTKVLDIMKRTSIGLTGAQTSGTGSRPRGVLFFAGPTGVGKTEMAKAIAELVFGDEAACLRFDMSEFSAEHSGDRLIGAPPGYVGFDQGGELTNAMREQPFRVLLFDEIEKSHHRILDKFLQVLEDGRLTDGRGETVYFSEALIIFTSNLGITRERDGVVEMLVSANDPVEEFEQKIMAGVRDHFERTLRRPELLNRIGENVVIFNFISPEIGRIILDGMIDNVRRRITDEHGIRLDIAPEVTESLRRHCLADLRHGGRGIGAKLEAAFVNPLARALFSHMPPSGGVAKAIGLDYENGIFSLRLGE